MGFVKRSKSLKTPQKPAKRRLLKSLRVMGVLPLILIGGCSEKFAGLLVEAPKPVVSLPFLKLPKPQSVLPNNPTWKTMTEWETKVQAGEMRASDLVCMTQEDYANGKAWKKDVVRWMLQTNALVQFYEDKKDIEK